MTESWAKRRVVRPHLSHGCHPDEAVVGGALLLEIDEDGVTVQGLIMAALNVGGVDGAGAGGHEHILIVVHALLDEEVGFPVLIHLVVMKFRLRKYLPIGQFPENIDITSIERETAFEREVGVHIVFGIGVLHVAVAIETVAVHGAPALVCAKRAGVVLQHIGVVLVIGVGDAHDAVSVGVQCADVKGAELGASGHDMRPSS